MKASLNIIYSYEENMFMVSNNKKKRDYYVNMCLSNGKTNFNSKNGRKRCFSCEAIYPNEENVFMVPNYEMKGDYEVNLCLSQLEKEF